MSTLTRLLLTGTMLVPGVACHPRAPEMSLGNAPQPEMQIEAIAGCDSVRRAAPPDPAPFPRPRPPDRYLSHAREVPGGFAGWRRDAASGRWYLRLADTSQAASAREYLESQRGRGDHALTSGLTTADFARAGVDPVRWSLGELHDWLDWVNSLILGEAVASGITVHGTGVNSGRNMLTVVVGDQRSRAMAGQILANRSVPCGLVRIELGGPPVP